MRVCMHACVCVCVRARVRARVRLHRLVVVVNSEFGYLHLSVRITGVRVFVALSSHFH